jgi:Putative lumazine-binding
MTTANDVDVERSIVGAALDYYEGWFDGDAARMERALHPDLVKRSLADDGFSVETISAREMVDATAEGVGRSRDPGDRRIVVRVDHMYGDIATVTVTSAVYVDYLQLVSTRVGWKIVNALWQRVAPVAERLG